ncbi:MAG: translation initiation factor Sui1 [Proteobacteria bacterium]|nr:translation initiation factor Sui1 [Pseudomonadota bacterium]
MGSSTVYSSEQGRICPQCDNPVTRCSCRSSRSVEVGDGIVRVARSTKGRKGKGVTVVTGIPLSGAELKKLAKALKKQCGTGGTAKNGVIEIQGDHRQILVDKLTALGYRVKLSGG